MIRILLAEDQRMIRGALARLLDLEPDLAVVADVSSGDEVVPRALETRPDVALLDIQMPRLDGLAAAAALRRAMPACPVLILTTFARPGYVRRALEAGAAGFLAKDGPVEELTLTLPASTWCPMDERGLAGPAEPVDGTPWDFREGRPIGDAVIDHPFGGLVGSQASILAPDGAATTLTLHEGFDWLHVFTSDTHTPPRRSIAVEPTTCPPDAFRSGVDLVVLQPGESHRAAFTIAGSAPA